MEEYTNPFIWILAFLKKHIIYLLRRVNLNRCLKVYLQRRCFIDRRNRIVLGDGVLLTDAIE